MTEINYREYICGQDWRARRRTYLTKFPHCHRCGMDIHEHKERFGVALHVHHISYARLGAELDEDLETLCKLCHLGEETRESDPMEIGDYWAVTLGVGTPNPPRMVSGLSEGGGIDFSSRPETYWNNALGRINKRIKLIANNNEPSEEVWRQLERLHNLESFARMCLEI